jgi:hypothetical protein
LVSGKYAAGSCSECLYDHRRFVRIENYDDTGLGSPSRYLASNIKTSERFLFQSSANDGHVRFILFESFANSNCVSRITNHPGPVTPAPHRRRYQLTAQLTAVSDEDLYRSCASGRFRQLFAPVSYSRDPKTPNKV